ncbi:DNA/RNA helicase [Microbacterium bovistercoris]|uniref:DNA/RNA helicase n=1 Tax=Microbacterium bovistercoris TaxID=2293570 RepID=A0A371NT48_9MICO|nr:DEAD/DEAH box helicase [Microbacterium bovistercoris]REJ05473.1 DNA/RNA helicase [Microbacterium bovistercoris]
MPFPHIDDVTLNRHVGTVTLQRARDYLRTGMVLATRWDEGSSVLTATVRGSSIGDYACVIRIDATADVPRIMSSRCTCPMASACKHVAAAVLKADRESVIRSAAVAPERPKTEPWRRLIPESRAAARTPLALGFELRVHERSANPWSTKRTAPAEPRALAKGEVDVRLAMRPYTASPRTGAWIKGEVGWESFRRASPAYPVTQHRWFGDLLALARDSLLSGTAGEWILVDHVESDVFFDHLARADAAGVPLIAVHKHTDVRLAVTGTARMQVERADDGLLLRAAAQVDGEEAEHVRPIGRSGFYTWRVVDRRVEVVLAAGSLDEPTRTLLAEGGTIAVPSADEEEFFAEAYPALSRSATLTAGAGVVLPEVVRPTPVLSVMFRGGHTADHRLSWRYGGHGGFPVTPTGDAIRDADAEGEELRTVQGVWSAASDLRFAATGVVRDLDTARLLNEVVPALEEAGVEVVVTGDRPVYRELAGEPEITVSTVESTDPDWFDLGFIVKIDGKSIPFEPLFTALALRRKNLLLVDGSYFSLAHPALDRLRDLIDEAATLNEWETGPRISRYQTALWDDFEDLADQSAPAVSWRATVEALRAESGVPAVPAPVGLRADLRPYQQAGFEWLAFLREHRLGGILADDMGLGKTLQLLALVQHAHEAGEERPFLVVAPTSVLTAWRDEAARFTPGLRVRVVETSKASDIRDAAGSADLVVASYAVVRLAEHTFRDRDWAGLILDEAQFVKNPASQQHQAIAAIPAEVTYAVTGTPLENSLMDLWALFHLTAPGLFPSKRQFREDYVQPIEKGKVPENAEGADFRAGRIARLRRRIRPLMLRRTKELVASELPLKQEQILHVEPSPAHRAVYDTVLQRERQKILGLLKDLDRNRFIVFRSLTMLRMLALAPGLVDPDDAGLGSRKLDALVERAEELRAEGHRALVFSQFTSYLDLAEDRLKAAGIGYSRLDGATRKRGDVVDGFRDGDQTVFLISLKAGGFGLTLTEADYVFLLDPWWNPAAEAQAIDRTHRIGQREQVFVYRMISTGTIEEKVLALQQRKARLFTAVMDDDELFAKSLTADDIRALFEE